MDKNPPDDQGQLRARTQNQKLERPYLVGGLCDQWRQGQELHQQEPFHQPIGQELQRKASASSARVGEVG